MTAALLAGHHWHGGPGWFPLVPLLWIGLWVFVVVTVWRRRVGPHERAGEAVLAERFARGEIDEREYHDRRAVLRRKS